MNKKAKRIIFVILGVIVLIGSIVLMTFLFRKEEVIHQKLDTYSVILSFKMKDVDADYEINIDTNRHDAHLGDMNYLESKTKYYRFEETEKTITYFTYDCGPDFLDNGQCILKWSNYKASYDTSFEVREKDLTYLYQDLLSLLDDVSHEDCTKLISSEQMNPLLKYFQFIDATIDLRMNTNYLFKFEFNGTYLEKVIIESQLYSEDKIYIEFKNYNKFKTVEDLYEIDSRGNRPIS